MLKYSKRIHKITTITSILLVFISVVRLLLLWHLLPDNIGVHFSGDGTFDFYVNKNEWLPILYPYIVSIIIILISEFFVYLLNKAKIGLKVNKKKEETIKLAVEIFIDISIKCIWVFFLSVVWSNCVIKQYSLNKAIPLFLMSIQFISFIILIIFMIIIRYRKK